MSQTQKTIAINALENLYNTIINDTNDEKVVKYASLRYEAGINAIEKGWAKVARGAYVAMKKLSK